MNPYYCFFKGNNKLFKEKTTLIPTAKRKGVQKTYPQNNKTKETPLKEKDLKLQLCCICLPIGGLNFMAKHNMKMGYQRLNLVKHNWSFHGLCISWLTHVIALKELLSSIKLLRKDPKKISRLPRSSTPRLPVCCDFPNQTPCSDMGFQHVPVLMHLRYGALDFLKENMV